MITEEEKNSALFIQVAKEKASKSHTLEAEMSSSRKQLKSESNLFEDFFPLLIKGQQELPDNALYIEVLNYLKNQYTDFSMLNLYPNIKRLFMRYNTN